MGSLKLVTNGNKFGFGDCTRGEGPGHHLVCITPDLAFSAICGVEGKTASISGLSFLPTQGLKDQVAEVFEILASRAPLPAHLYDLYVDDVRNAPGKKSSKLQALDEVKASDDQKADCVCRKTIEGSELIGCDNEACVTGWFHLDCMGIKKVPKGAWYCPNCAAAMPKKSSRKRKASAS